MVKKQQIMTVVLLALVAPVEAQLSVGIRTAQMDDEFYRVQSAVRLDDGTILVSDASQVVRIYGRSFTRFGRQGSGPGEFQALQRVGSYRGDSLLAWDSRLSRASIFTSDGEFVRSVRINPPGGEGRVYLIGWRDSGQLLAYEDVRDRRLGTSVSVARVFTTDPEGRNAEVLFDHVGKESTANQERRPGAAVRMDIILPWGQKTLFEHADGRLVTVDNLDGEVMAVAGSDTVQFTVQGSRIPWSDDFVEEFATQLAEGADDRVSLLARMLSAAPTPDYLPLISRVLPGPNGEIWLERFPRPDNDQSTWAIYDSTGNLVDNLEMPERFRLLYVGADYLLGVTQGDLDIETVEVYRLGR